MRFKAGDKVKCIMGTGSGSLHAGNEYVCLTDSYLIEDDGEYYIQLVDGEGSEWSTSRFKLVKEEAKPAAGLRHNSNKPRWRNFPMHLMEPLVMVGSHAELREGNPHGKYPTYNFLKGLSVADTIDSLKRHLAKLDNPALSDLDDETGQHHLAHIAWNALVALHFINTRKDLDDRYKGEDDASGK